MKSTKAKLVTYFISICLMIASFILPPTGEIHPSVLVATSIVIFGYEFLFGKTVKSIDISKDGVHMETFDKDKDVED